MASGARNQVVPVAAVRATRFPRMLFRQALTSGRAVNWMSLVLLWALRPLMPTLLQLS